eukprot:4096548-Lingulodinium_polyedra.AAC.1
MPGQRWRCRFLLVASSRFSSGSARRPCSAPLTGRPCAGPGAARLPSLQPGGGHLLRVGDQHQPWQ